MSGLQSQELREPESQAVGTACTKAQRHRYNIEVGDSNGCSRNRVCSEGKVKEDARKKPLFSCSNLLWILRYS